MRNAQAPSVSSLKIGPLGVRSERRVGRRALSENLAGAIENDDLDVRLADVEDRNAAVHARKFLTPDPPSSLDKLGMREGSGAGTPQKSNFVTLSLLKMKGGPSRISLPLTTLSLPSLPASTEVAPGFNFPSTTARMT